MIDREGHFFVIRRLIRSGPVGRRAHWLFILAAFGLISVAAGMAQVQGSAAKGQEAPKGQEVQGQVASDTAKPVAADDAAKPTDPKPADPALQRKKQLEDDTAKLLVLANELKAEMDKSTKDTLSLSVMKKADEIEKLARKVREEMKTTLGN
jgi:hypothetical protein